MQCNVDVKSFYRAKLWVLLTRSRNFQLYNTILFIWRGWRGWNAAVINFTLLIFRWLISYEICYLQQKYDFQASGVGLDFTSTITLAIYMLIAPKIFIFFNVDHNMDYQFTAGWMGLMPGHNPATNRIS